MTEPIIPLIMCGGAGTRLWPASREGRPKQFLRLFGPHSTFQETICRVDEPSVFGRPIIVTNHQYRFLVAEQLAEIGIEADILLEPHRRDSAPAIIAGACTRCAGAKSQSYSRSRPTCDHRRRRLCRFLPDCAGRDRGWIYRDIRSDAGSASDRIWLYPSRQDVVRWRLRRRAVRGEA